MKSIDKEPKSLFCMKMYNDFWEILSAALAEADCKDVCPAEFREWLSETDFFTAPASTKFHGDFPGGLAAHSIYVYRELMKIINAHNYQYENLNLAYKQAAIVALLHDVCKIGCYHAADIDSGAKYTYRDPLPLGHGEKSVMLLLQHGFKLTEVEMLAIRWHMGAYRDRDARELDAAQRIPLVLHLHLADMMASHWEGKQCGTN